MTFDKHLNTELMPFLRHFKMLQWDFCNALWLLKDNSGRKSSYGHTMISRNAQNRLYNRHNVVFKKSDNLCVSPSNTYQTHTKHIPNTYQTHTKHIPNTYYINYGNKTNSFRLRWSETKNLKISIPDNIFFLYLIIIKPCTLKYLENIHQKPKLKFS